MGDYESYGQMCSKIVGYNYEDKYEEYEEQDKQMIIGQYIYRTDCVCEEEKLAINIKVRSTVIGSPIIISHKKQFAVIGLFVRPNFESKLSAGLLINNLKIEAIRNWIIEMNQFPKFLIYQSRRSSRDSGCSRK